MQAPSWKAKRLLSAKDRGTSSVSASACAGPWVDPEALDEGGQQKRREGRDNASNDEVAEVCAPGIRRGRARR